MKSFQINGQKREALGKKESKKVRNGENVPCVLYGGQQPIHMSVPFSELRNIIYSPDVFLINLNIAGENHNAIIQDMQWHPVEE